ncbi:MAG TPA: RtcB family protein [Marisediminicola sp.]|nr:RtcB family protein [Marisediminicola sp.]
MTQTTITTFGDLDQRSLDQLTRCADAGDADYAVLCADHHPGYSQPIGGVVAYRDFISPSGVGYDIACGNKAVKTNLSLTDGLPIAAIMDEIVKTISFGVGRNNKTRVDDAVIDEIRNASFAPQRRLVELAAGQLGTVGSGNHYVDLFADEEGAIWIGVHFGSRGFGHKTASGFLALAQGLQFDAQAREGEMDSPPVLFPIDSELGQAYIDSMKLAGTYAYAGRNAVAATVLGILGAESVEEVHNHHNFAWHEAHDGVDYWVIRKGATPAFPGQRGFVGGSMGDISVILEGVETEEAKSALYSTVHGAGRVMSRTQAAGRWKKVLEERTDRNGKTSQVKRRVRSGGLIDWNATRRDLAARGIELRGAGADEAPGVYKRLPDVLGHHAGSVRVLHTLTPLGVAMAGDDTFDPYKD